MKWDWLTIQLSDYCPPDQIWLGQDAKIVGKVVNIGKDDDEGAADGNSGDATD